MMRWFERCPKWAWLVPPTILTLVVFTLAVDVLHWDEWTIWGEMLHKLDAGTFSLLDLAAQQNEQRNLAARIFGLLLMPLFKLNRFAEYGLNILIAGTGMTAAIRLYTKTATTVAKPYVWLIFSMLAFSLLQWEAFTFGANSSVIILPAALWVGLMIANAEQPTVLRLIVLGGIGILPSFSFANGLFYWFCILPVIGFKAHKNGTLSRVLPVWGVMTCAAWGLYFWDFGSPIHHPSLLNGLAHPMQFIGYFFAYLGGGISSDKNLFLVAVLVGLVSFPLFCTLAFREWQTGGDRREHMLPWLGAALFTLCSAGVTTIARSEFGIEQALESRYASFSTPYWMALFALTFMAWEHKKQTSPGRATQVFMTTFFGVMLLSTLLSTVVVYNRHEGFVRARKALFTLTDERGLETIFPDTAYLMMQLPLLMEKRLSIYRDIPTMDDLEVLPEHSGKYAVVGSHSAAQDRIKGIMIQGSLTVPGKAIVLLAGESVVGYLPKPQAQWRIFLPLANLPKGQSQLQAFLVTAQGLSHLMPKQGIPVERGVLPPVDYDFHKYFFIR